MATKNVTLAQVAEAVARPRSVVDNWSLNRLRSAPPFPEVVERHGRLKFYKWAEVKAWLKEANQKVVNPIK